MIFYDDRAPYTGRPEVAPERGVQAIVQADPDVGWYCITGKDYYVWLGDEWQGVDAFGLFDYLATPGWKRVLFGRMVRAEEYDRIYAKALAAMGAKSAYKPDERQ